MRLAFSVRSRLPKLHIVIALLASAFSVADLGAQEYTLQDFVNDADAVIVARIVSKEASRIEVRTRQPDGRISESTPIFTTYGVELIEYSGPEKFSDIREFVLPGGTIGLRKSSRTHTPEFEIGSQILISLAHDELNDYYIPRGVPPLGQDAGVYIVLEEYGNRLLVPYSSYTPPEHSMAKIGVDKVKSNVSLRFEMLVLEEADAIDFDSFWTAVMEAVDQK